MYDTMRKLRYEISDNMTLLTGWAAPFSGWNAGLPDFSCGFFVCAMTAESAGLLADLPKKLDAPCVSRMTLLVEELHGVKFFGIHDLFLPRMFCAKDIPVPEIVKKIQDSFQPPQTRFSPVSQAEFSSITTFCRETGNMMLAETSIEIAPPGRKNQNGEIRFAIRFGTGRTYGKVCSPAELREIFVEPDDRPQAGMRP